MAGLSRESAALVATSILLALWFIKVIRRAYFTPIRAIPGPWYSKFTHLWLKKYILAGRRMHYVHDMHLKYGPVVRVAPDEIDICDKAAFKEIHRIGSGYLKSPWYQSFRKGETQDVFSMIDPREHAQRRKLFAPLFSNSALINNWYDTIVDKVTMAVDKMKGEALKHGQVDIFKWWTFMSADIISHLAFGEPLGMLEQEKKTYHMQKIEDAAKFGLVSSELPWVRNLLAVLPIPAVREVINTDNEVQDLAAATMSKVMRSGLGITNIFSKIVAEKEKDTVTLSDYQLAFEAGGFIVAGSGTTAVTLTYLVWAVLSSPSVQVKLEAEVGALPETYTEADLEGLPYLAAVIEETLRLYGAAPGSLPRIVPKGGATLVGYYIPEGITVSTQSYSLHRDPDSYQEPERFSPDRFLRPSGDFIPPKTGVYAPFGAGSRVCIGIHLARLELRHGAAMFFRKMRGARLAPQTTQSSMSLVNYFLVTPKAEQCWVTLPPTSGGED